jgi:hypothetical protein
MAPVAIGHANPPRSRPSRTDAATAVMRALAKLKAADSGVPFPGKEAGTTKCR